jgi:hypothetical protein
MLCGDCSHHPVLSCWHTRQVPGSQSFHSHQSKFQSINFMGFLDCGCMCCVILFVLDAWSLTSLLGVSTQPQTCLCQLSALTGFSLTRPLRGAGTNPLCELNAQRPPPRLRPSPFPGAVLYAPPWPYQWGPSTSISEVRKAHQGHYWRRCWPVLTQLSWRPQQPAHAVGGLQLQHSGTHTANDRPLGVLRETPVNNHGV